MLENFSIMADNPNDAVGGGGCLCSDTKVEGCKGPYVVFNATETDFCPSPFPVIGTACLHAAMYEKMEGPTVVDSDAIDEDDIPEV